MVSVLDSVQIKHRFVLKEQENRAAFCLYTHYLKPFDLNSPKQYGYIDVDDQLFLVMDYVQHLIPNWSDSNSYLKALDWLIKKDVVTSQHVDSLRKLECFGEITYDGVQDWLSQFERWSQDSLANSQAWHIWRIVHANQSRIETYREELHSVGLQTVVHGDIHLSNVLFGANEFENEVFVIDWTQPHIGSVTTDLAHLYDNAPSNIKQALLSLYRKRINFPSFDEMFVKAKLIRDIGYLSWMAGMICDHGQEAMDQQEIDRVMQSITRSLE
jgi:thiamine kinase-like enzyme